MVLISQSIEILTDRHVDAAVPPAGAWGGQEVSPPIFAGRLMHHHNVAGGGNRLKGFEQVRA
jgi:hypothetical protein